METPDFLKLKEMEFSLGGQTSNLLTVSFLVTDTLSISRPIIGFNTITYLISGMGTEATSYQLTSAFNNAEEGTVCEICSLLAADDDFGTVMIGKRDTCICIFKAN